MSNNAKKRTSEPISAKLARFNEQLDWFCGDDFSLDEALANYKAAQALADEIKTDLASLENEVKVLADFTKENA